MGGGYKKLKLSEINWSLYGNQVMNISNAFFNQVVILIELLIKRGSAECALVTQDSHGSIFIKSSNILLKILNNVHCL